MKLNVTLKELQNAIKPIQKVLRSDKIRLSYELCIKTHRDKVFALHLTDRENHIVTTGEALIVTPYTQILVSADIFIPYVLSLQGDDKEIVNIESQVNRVWVKYLNKMEIFHLFEIDKHKSKLYENTFSGGKTYCA